MKKITDEDIVNVNLKELHKYINIPNGMYLGISGSDLDVVNIFREDRSLFKEYKLEDWSSETLEELAKEIEGDLSE